MQHTMKDSIEELLVDKHLLLQLRIDFAHNDSIFTSSCNSNDFLCEKYQSEKTFKKYRVRTTLLI